MSNAPFKIAFWVMSLAFGLTVLLTGLKPEAIRSALNPNLQMEEEEIAHQEFSSEFDRSEKGNSVVGDHSIVSPMPQPIQVASADIDAPLGITDNTSSVNLDRFSFDTESIPSSTIQSPYEEEIQILVPEPAESYSSHTQEDVGHEVARLKKKVLRLQLAHAHREIEDIQRETEQQEVERVESQLKQLRDQIENLKEQRSKIQEAATSCVEDESSISELEIPETITPEPMPVVFVESERVADPESRIEVMAGTKEKTYSFHFENADIHDVLETLATRAGWKVVVRPEVEGTFSGIFEDAVPNQAFATVVKLNSFGVSFRGDYVLVRAHKDAQIR